MRLTYDTTAKRFLFYCSYDEKNIAKDAGFWWDKDAKTWYAAEAVIASRLSFYSDSTAEARLSAFHAQAQENIKASSQTDSGIDVPHPKHFDYLPYQLAGIEFALKNKDVLLADEMGLGKTIQAIGYLNARSDVGRVLVICPAGLKINWGKEIARWLTRKLTWGIAHSKYYPYCADIIIINYDILKKYRDVLTQKPWDLLIIDEAHFIKNKKAQRSKVVYGVRGNKTQGIEPVPGIEAKYKLLLTGTPICNRPSELFPLINYLKPNLFPSFYDYAKRYCGGQQTGGWFGGRKSFNFNGASNLDELQHLLRSSVMVRRMKRDVLTDLPPKRRQIIELPSNGMAEMVSSERDAFDSNKEQMDSLRSAVNSAREANNTQAYRAALSELKGLMGRIMGQVSTLRKQVAIAKAPLVVEHLKNCIESEGKVICFAHHHDVVDIIYSAFGAAAAVKFTGRENAEIKELAVTRFMHDANCKLFIGSITAAGVGITLTSSSHVVFAELDWVPGNITQAEDRCHRIGQQNSVLVQHLVLEKSLDLYIAQKVIDKQEVIEQAVGG